jgi:hypothetical protein
MSCLRIQVFLAPEMQLWFLFSPNVSGKQNKPRSKAARKKKVKLESAFDSLIVIDTEDDLAKAPVGHDELQESVQMDVGKETISPNICNDATTEEIIKSGNCAEVVPCPSDVALPSKKEPKGKLSNINCFVKMGWIMNALIPKQFT